MAARNVISGRNPLNKPRSKTAHSAIIEGCQQINKKSDGPIAKYLLKTDTETLHESGLIRQTTFGKKDPSKMNKTILMMGETGTGKSTLINMMVNYIIGVEWEDKYRFEIIAAENKSQTESQTTAITAYEIFGEESDHVPFSLTIIDTPGFGDTQGIEQDELITKHLQELFTSPRGVDKIDGVCLVVKANQCRLTPTQQYIFDSVLSIFGKDIENNIVTLVTHADNGEPLVLEALEKANVPSLKNDMNKPVYFKFNNLFLCQNEDDEEQNDDELDEDEEEKESEGDEKEEENDRLAWEMSMENMSKFCEALDVMDAKSLMLTQQVLKERKRLEIVCQTLTDRFNDTMQQMQKLKKQKNTLMQHEKDIEANRNFSILLVESGKEKCAVDKKATNCTVCKETCHHPCTEMFRCIVHRNNKCTVCSCSQGDHITEKFIYVFKTEEHSSAYLDLLLKRLDLTVDSLSAHVILDLVSTKIDSLLLHSLTLLLQIYNIIQKLSMIALKPNPTSRLAFLDLQIEKAKKEKDFEKVKILEEMKDNELIQTNLINMNEDGVLELVF